MRGRLSRGLDRLFDLVPQGVELHGLRELVADDLVDDSSIRDLMGPSASELTSTDIPRIRPILVAVAARAAGAKVVDGEAQYAAELLQQALRMHDLALGREGGRRRRVARRLVRRSVNWLTGNHLTLRALELSRNSSPGVLEDVVDTLRSFSDGQALSRELLGAIPDEQDWLEHADAHTGALFAFCCRAGGHMARAGAGELSALGRYGRHVGRMWHVAEDLSVLAHGPAEHHLMARAAVGRPMLPVVQAIAREPDLGVAWASLAIDPVESTATYLVDRVRSLGLVESREAMVGESWRARKALRVLPESRYRVAMDRLASSVARAGVKAR